MKTLKISILAALALLLLLPVGPSFAATATIKITGRLLVNDAGDKVQLRGINRAIFESRCTYDSSGNADGPEDQTSINAMLTWKINAIRVSLNEDCWLGINGLPLSGDAVGYRREVQAYVRLLTNSGLYVILENHVTAPGTFRSDRIDYMPDRDHAIALWRSISATFKAYRNIIFDPVNEAAMASYNDPHPQPPGQWRCWLKGCQLDSMYGGRFAAVGLQTLVDTIRGQGANQPIILGGLAYNSDLSLLLSNLPTDPQRQLLASTHIYDFTIGSGSDAFFTDQLEPIAAKMPVIVGELGERNCDSGTASFTKHLLALVDGERRKGNIFGALGWTWNAKTSQSTGWHCPTGQFGDGGPLLIRAYSGTPTVLGGVLRNWIQSRAGTP